jgi:signal transduction histidine kinase
MLGQINRLDTLVAELLAMTQRVKPEPVALELRSFLESEVAPYRPVASARGVTIAVLTENAAVKLDPGIVGRILGNLLANAIRHAPEGGQVTVAGERSPTVLTITMEDTGNGVAADLKDRLFEPFVTGRAEGTGLGLAIARELADAHGGRLELRRAGGDARGEGAIFALVLPLEDQCRPS